MKAQVVNYLQKYLVAPNMQSRAECRAIARDCAVGTDFYASSVAALRRLVKLFLLLALAVRLRRLGGGFILAALLLKLDLRGVEDAVLGKRTRQHQVGTRVHLVGKIAVVADL